jgi:hypothetical protein
MKPSGHDQIFVLFSRRFPNPLSDILPVQEIEGKKNNLNLIPLVKNVGRILLFTWNQFFFLHVFAKSHRSHIKYFKCIFGFIVFAYIHFISLIVILFVLFLSIWKKICFIIRKLFNKFH